MYLFIYIHSNQHFKAFLIHVQIQFRDKFSLSTFQEEFKNHTFTVMQAYFNAYFSFSFFLSFCIYLDIHIIRCMYLYIFIPSNQHFKPFPVSKINSETIFLVSTLQRKFKFHSFKSIQTLHTSQGDFRLMSLTAGRLGMPFILKRPVT